MSRLFSVYIPAVTFVVALVLVVTFADSLMLLKDLIGEPGLIGYVAYVLSLVLAIVAMPVTVMPLIPIATLVFGPFVTAILSVIGWTLGGLLAFLAARYLGRPVLEHFISMDKVDELADKIPKESRFLVIVLLRLTMPVDLVSYALGLSRVIGVVEYTLATFLGVIWFSFAFAYLGDAIFTHDKLLLIELGAMSLGVFILGWYALQRANKK